MIVTLVKTIVLSDGERMKCKHSENNCVTRIINQDGGEIRACEYGVSCNYQNKQKVNLSLFKVRNP